MGRTGWRKEAKGSVLGTMSLDTPWEPLVMTGLRVSPSSDQAPSPEPLIGLPYRCTRKERCERSREPHRFASEMKQCVRLTVHPSNISVSQYNVLVRTVRAGPRDVGRTLSAPKRAAAQCPSRGLGPTWPAVRSESRTGMLQMVSLRLEEGAGREILILGKRLYA